MEDQPNGSDLTRRDFLKATGKGAAAAVAGKALLGAPRPAAAAPAASPRIIGANDRVNVAVVGVKGMGGGHIKHVLEYMPDENVAITAVCDVWDKARLKAQTDSKLPASQAYLDYRRMLEQRDIDAVIVATPDHTHREVAIAALESGRHVYLEKPMTRHLDEAFDIMDTARTTRCLLQLGAQGCTDPGWRKASEVIAAGKLGRLLWAQGSYCRHNPNGEWNYDVDPDANERTVDWRRWLGPARKRPWSPERYFRWRKYWDYGTGLIGDLLPHRLAPLMMAMGLREYPKQVSCMGRNLLDADRGPNPVTGQPWGERREVADTHVVIVEFPSGAMLFLATTTSNERGVEDVIRGNKANLSLGGGKVLLEPERPYVDEIEREDLSPVPDTREDALARNHANHVRNFIQGIRGTAPLHCPVDLACQVQTVVSMAEKSYREGRRVRFDPARRKMRT
jgi:predicted dehydrogenase